MSIKLANNFSLKIRGLDRYNLVINSMLIRSDMSCALVEFRSVIKKQIGL
jgi:hypothetical protein